MPSYLIALIVPCYCLCLVRGHDIASADSSQEPLIPEGVDIHLLCEARLYFQRSLLVYPKPHKVLSWCKSWDKYIDGLILACLHGKHVLVVVPNNRWKNVLRQTAALRKDICPHIKWLKLERAHGKGFPQEFSQHVSVHSWKNATQTSPFAKTANNRTSLSTEALPGRAWYWAALSGKKVRTGCVAYNETGKQNSCDSTEGIAFLHALRQLNVSAHVTPVRRGAFAEILRNNRADIVVISVGLTEDRYQYFDFTVNKFGQAVFHVQKRWRRHADFFLGALPWTILLALSTLISVASFALLNLRRAKRPTSNLGSVVLALIATTLSFNSPLHRDHARSSSGRVVMAFWMLACFSLAAYTRSLLTASLTAKPTWEADDTFEEMLPKLHRGRLLPCAEKNSFFHVLLKMAAGNSSDVVDVMALAARRSGHMGRGFTGSFQSCLERTRKGTHLLFSEGINFCKYSRFEKAIVEGEKPIRSLIGGFPIRRGYPLRAELILLTHRIFETGWDIKFSRSQDWNCSGIVENDEVGFGVTYLLYVYGALCGVSFFALLIECLHKGLFDKREVPVSSRWITSNYVANGRVPVNCARSRRRIGRRVVLRRLGTLDQIGQYPAIWIRAAP